MAVDVRGQIFELRLAGVSQRGIARQLGISSSKVQRELSKRAPEVQAERLDGLEDGPARYTPAGAGRAPVDPELAEEFAQVERERLQLQRAQIRSQRLEAERRAQLLEHPEAGQGNGLAALMLQAIDRMREDNRSLLSQLANRQAAPPPAPPSLTEQLSQWRQIGETMTSFAPPKAPSSPTDLEFVVAKERLNLEGQDLAARREAELGERRERAQSESRRNDAVATAIEQFAPVAAKALEIWLADRAPAPAVAPQLPAASGLEQAAPAVVDGEVEGACPNCQTQVAIAGGQDEQCPRCKSTLVVVGGRIRVRLSNAELYPPLQG